MRINLQFHETLSGVIAGQSKMQFDIFRWINVTRCKYPFVHIVAHHAIKSVPKDLLRVLRQPNKIGILLIAVRTQHYVQSCLAQAVLGRRMKENVTMRVVSNLLNQHVLAVYDECEQGECLAQGKAGVEQFRSIVVSGLSGHTRCQF